MSEPTTCGCRADTELAAGPVCTVCGHRDHGRSGCRAIVAAKPEPTTEAGRVMMREHTSASLHMVRHVLAIEDEARRQPADPQAPSPERLREPIEIVLAAIAGDYGKDTADRVRAALAAHPTPAEEPACPYCGRPGGTEHMNRAHPNLPGSSSPAAVASALAVAPDLETAETGGER